MSSRRSKGYDVRACHRWRSSVLAIVREGTMSKNKLLQYVVRYGTAVACVALAFALDLWLPVVEDSAAVLFLAAVALSAYRGGVGPGLLATALSTVLLDYFFVGEIRAVDFGPAIYVSL